MIAFELEQFGVGQICAECRADLTVEAAGIRCGCDWFCGECFDQLLNEFERAEHGHYLLFGTKEERGFYDY